MNEKTPNKVLIVTYYWPPSGGSGVQRWLKMAKYLRDFGWEPVIFTPENPDFDLQDQSLLAEVPADIEVIRFPIWEPTRVFFGKGKNMQKGQLLQAKHQGILGKIATWIRGNFLLPDPKVFWAKPAAAFIKEIWRENEFKVLITTGPPHSMHLIGLRLKKDLGVTWVADFRDPWSRWDLLEDFSSGSMAMRYHKKKENEVLQLANRVVTIGHQLAKDLEKLGGRRVEIVHNGYDQANIPAVENKEPRSILHLAHIGTITHSRFPLEWLESLLELCQEGEISSSQLRIRIIGNIDQELPDWVAQHHQLMEIFSFESYMPHHEVFTAIGESDLCWYSKIELKMPKRICRLRCLNTWACKNLYG